MKANNPNLKKNFTKLSNFTLDLYCPEYFLKETRICCNQAVVAFFYNILKVVLVLLQGGPPPAPPAAPQGAGLSARRLCKIRTQQNVEVYGRSEDETPRKCILQAENIMPGSKKL